jgi:hypothetical protein
MHRGFSLVSSLSSISELSASTANINLNSSTALSEQEQHEIAMEEAKRQRVNIIRGLCSSSTRSKLESMRKILAVRGKI